MSEDQYGQRDPQSQFGDPQEQRSEQIPHPGTTGQMDDKPDHGEDSYRGSGRQLIGGPGLKFGQLSYINVLHRSILGPMRPGKAGAE